MSGIAVIYNRDGRPLESLLLDRLVAAATNRGPDGTGRWIDGPVGLGHLMFRTTPESLDEKLPLCDGATGLGLTFDGRVDNRDELGAALKASGIQLRTGTDADLVLGAYQRWGGDCPAHILGDFAFAIWDAKRRELFCARDPAGVRPCFYFCDGRTFIAASELRQILEHPDIAREPNEGFVGEYLTGTLFSRSETLFRDIMRLEAAHSLTVTADRVVKRRYFDLNPAKRIRYRTDEQYAEHFLEIMREAVRCRMRGYGRLGAELSGGLDSSSVVGVAQTLIRENQAPDLGFETFSLWYPDPDCDERSYINEVVKMWGLEANIERGFDLDLATCADTVRRYLDFPGYPNGHSFNIIKRTAREKGFRVLLTGLGSDQWMTGSEYYYADLIRGLKFGEIMRRLPNDWGWGYDRNRLAILLKQGIWPLLPLGLRRLIKERVLSRNPFPENINRDFAARIGLADRMMAPIPRPGPMSFADFTVYEVFVNGFMAHVFEIVDREGNEFGIEQRHPFYDLRLIEFLFAVPENQRSRDNKIKFVMRNAMRGLLPESIRERTTKGEFSNTVIDTFKRMDGKKFFESMATEAAGWVNGGELRRLYADRVENGSGRNLWPIWTTFAVELWYRELFGHPHGSESGKSLAVTSDSRLYSSFKTLDRDSLA